MGIDAEREAMAHVAALSQERWTELLPAIESATDWLSKRSFTEKAADDVAAALAQLAFHRKWEVRRSVALVAGKLRHRALAEVLPRLLADPHTSVKQAAETSSLKRREFRVSGELGRERTSMVNRALGDIEDRYGARARASAQRAAAEMVNTFSRELYHEVVHHLTPLSREIAQLRSSIKSNAPIASLMAHTDLIQRDVNQIMSVLKGMRRYTAPPQASISHELVHEVVNESIHTVSDLAERLGVPLENRVPKSVVADIVRDRLVQALSNLLHNSLEAYEGLNRRNPVVIEGSQSGDLVRVSIQDQGCGMSAEHAREARVLFSTHKAHGNGIGVPLAIKIVESEHDGELTIDSVDGEGTKVTIVLPRFQRTP